MAVYTVKLKRQPKDGDIINEQSNFKFFKAPTGIPPAKFDITLKRYLTGLDHEDPQLNSLPKAEKDKEKLRRKDKLRELEGLTGITLNPLNFEYWDTLVVDMYQGRTLDTSNPHDEIIITALKRRGDIPFGRDEIWNPECRDIEFYLETAEGAKLGSSTHRRKKTRAIAELSKLLDNRERLFNVAYFLNMSPKKDDTTDELEDKLTFFLEADEDNLEKFINAAAMDNERISNINLFKRAHKSRVVQFEPNTKVYYRGNSNYKATVEESIDFLMLPTNKSELNEIAEALAKVEKGKLFYA